MSWFSRLRDALVSKPLPSRNVPPPHTPRRPPRPPSAPSAPGPPSHSPMALTPNAPPEMIGDPVVAALIQDAWLNHNVDPDLRVELRQGLRVYVWQHYGIQFDDIFDWDAWREAYGEGGAA